MSFKDIKMSSIILAVIGFSMCMFTAATQPFLVYFVAGVGGGLTGIGVSFGILEGCRILRGNKK